MDVNSLCRICCVKKTCSQLEDIYVSIDSEDKNMRPFCLHNFMSDFFGIMISEDDNLPQKICKHCKSDVLQTYKLVKLCNKSDKKLRSLFLGRDNNDIFDIKSESNIKLHKRNYKVMIWKKKYEKIRQPKKKRRSKLDQNIVDYEATVKVEYDGELENTIAGSTEKIVIKNTIIPPVSLPNLNLSAHSESKDSHEDQYVKLFLKMADESSKEIKTSENYSKTGTENTDQKIAQPNNELNFSNNKNEIINSCLVESKSLPLNLNHLSDEESNSPFDQDIDSDCQKDTDDILDSMSNPYVCNVCGVTLCSKGSLRVHQVTHSSERPYACDKCDLKFKLKSHLIGHQRNIHEGVKKHFCKVCSKSFFGSAQLKFHVMTHTKEYPHLCTHCGKRFAQQGYLRVHQKIHSGIKDLKCDQCDYISGNKSSMRMHIKGVHEVDKKHQCSDCGLRFMYPSGLEKHMTIHTGIKKHTCAECNKTFRTTANLNDHKRIHSNEKPYNCRHCDKSFRMFTHRTIHERIHTGIKPYICVICTKGFQTRSNLNVHQKTHNKA